MMSETPNTKPTLHVRFTDSVLVSRREWIDGEPREIPEAEWNARVRIEELEKALRAMIEIFDAEDARKSMADDFVYRARDTNTNHAVDAARKALNGGK